MKIDHIVKSGSMTVTVSGRLDTTTSPELESFLDNNLSGITDLTFDLADLAYVSSAGLRVFLRAKKAMTGKGGMKLTNVQSGVLDIFEVTGFTDILDIES